MSNLHRTTISRIFDGILKVLENWPSLQLFLPNENDWLAAHDHAIRESYPDYLFYFVDGTVIQCYDAHDVKTHRQLYNTKHGLCGFCFWILVTPNGRIVYVSDLFEGSKHDKTMWDESTIVQELEATCRNRVQTNLNLAIGGDKAYPNIKIPNNWHIFITKSGESQDNPVEERFHAASDIAMYRSVVERSFGGMKKFKSLLCLDLTTPCQIRLIRIIKVVAALYNLKIK
jgi:hypothetical protein